MNNLTKLKQAINNWNDFVVDCTSKDVDALWVENHIHQSFNSNDNDSIEYGKQANKQLFFD